MSENPNEYQLITFDPGAAATGWAYFIVSYKAFSRPEARVLRWVTFWNCGEFTGQEHAQLGDAVRLLNTPFRGVYRGRVDIVSEQFDLVQTIGGKNLLSPVRINAVLDWECAKRGTTLQLQARQLRTNVTKERLRLFGFTDRFRKDEFAAMQHAIKWLQRLKQRARELPWKLADNTKENAYWDCACERGKSCNLRHPR